MADELLKFSRCFDRVVDMIPREVYSAQEDDTANQSWNKYGHKTKKQAVSRQKKSYDPDSTAAAAQPAVSAEAEDTAEGPVGSGIDFTRRADLEELRKKLKQRLERSSNRPALKLPATGLLKKRDDDEVASAPKKPKVSVMNLEFSRVESRDEDDLRKKVGKPGSKKKKKLNLLMKAEKSKTIEKELQAAGAHEEAQGIAWKKALERADGKKVLDDPTKIRKSIKRDNKKAEKSTKKWKEIKYQVDKQIRDTQAKRNENLKKKKERGKMRTQKGGDKKRPGFEGKKKGFVSKKGGHNE